MSSRREKHDGLSPFLSHSLPSRRPPWACRGVLSARHLLFPPVLIELLSYELITILTLFERSGSAYLPKPNLRDVVSVAGDLELVRRSCRTPATFVTRT